MKIAKYLVLYLCVCLFLSACSISEKNGDHYYLSAIEELKAENYTKSVEYCQIAITKGVKLIPLDSVFKAEGVSYLELGLYDDAIKCFEEALSINGNNYQVCINLGVAYRQKGDYDKAEECYLKSISIEPGYAKAQSSLGTLSLLKNEPEKAIEYFKKAIQLDSSIAVAHGNLALAFAMVGNFAEADKALDQSKGLGYNNVDHIQQKIDDIKTKNALIK